MAQTPLRNHASRRHHKHFVRMPLFDPQRHVVPTTIVPKSKLVPINAVRPITNTVPKTSVTRPRHDKIVVTKPNSPPRRHINHSPSPEASHFLPTITVVKAPMVNVAQIVQEKWEWKPKCPILDHGNPQHALKDKEVIDSGYSRHMIGNMSYLSDFEELNGGYVAFGGNPKGGKISGKGKIRTGKLDFDDVYFVKELKFSLFNVSQMCDKKNSALFTDTECLVLFPEFKLPDESQVLLRVSRENNMYNVNLKNIVPSGDLICLFAKETLDESNLWHRRLGHINFKTMNKLVKEKARKEIVQQYVLFPVWSFGSTNPQNIDGVAAFDEKEPEFKGRKPEFEVNVSPSSSAYINEDNVAGTLVLDVGQLSPNNTNTFSTAGPSNAAASLTQGKSSCKNTSQLPDDPNMPELEDITYSDDEDDVGAEADFKNLETSVSLIPTTRVHKDHPVTQIIGHTQEEGIDYEEVFTPVARIEAIRLFLAYASLMGFLVYQMDVMCAFLCGTIEEEVYLYQPLGFEDPNYPDKVYKVVKPLYGLHQAPRAWYETLANYLLENCFQRGKIDQTLFIKRQKDDILLVQIYVDDIIFASTPIDTEKSLVKDPDGEDVDVHTYRSMIGSLMYLTSSRPDIMFAISIAVKKVNVVMRLQALVDKKKVVILEASIRDALRLDDAEGVECLPNEEIFAELARMGYEKPSTMLTFYKTLFSSQWKFLIHIILQCMSVKGTSWNEFSSSMASAVICLSTGKGFSGVETPLFEGMIVDQQVDEGDDEVNDEGVPAAGVVAKGVVSAADDVVPTDVEEPSIPFPTLPTPPPQPSQDQPSTSQKLERKNKASKLQRLKRVGTAQRIETSDDTVMDDVSKQERIIADMDADKDVIIEDAKEVVVEKSVDVLSMQDDEGEPAELQEAVDIVTTAKLISEVVTAAKEPKPLKKQAQIEQDEANARELEAELNKNIDWDETEAQARKNMMIYLKNVAGFKMEYFKGMTYDDIHPIFKKHFDSNVAFLQKTKEQIDEEDSRAVKRLNESQEDKAAKKEIMDEEVKELRRHLQIVPNDEDDVYTEATPLVRKVPVVDCEIYTENNKPYYKIKRDDGSHQLYLKRRYPLTRFTLDQMVNNVRLEVEEESEVSLELLSFRVDAAKEVKEYMLSDYCCQAKLMLLINAVKSN
nr:copia protein [Tanacetum cinerariifolium]